MTIQTVNPATGALIKNYEEMSQDQFNNIIEETHKAYNIWRKKSFSERSQCMINAAQILRQNKNDYAHLMAKEMGKPIVSGQAEIEKCAWVCEHYAKNAADYLKPRAIETEMQQSMVTYQPSGIVFAIMPWNFPFWQVFRFAAPTLMAGNAALLKHAPISTGTGLAIEKLFAEAQFPENLFRTLILTNEGASQVIQNPRVVAVTLTGSDKAGRIVGAEAAKSLKKVVLELGGSDPYIILEDANLEDAAEAIVRSRMNNSGQVCIAAKRILAVDPVRDELLNIILDKLQKYVMDDPQNEGTNFGPMARADLRDEVHHQVQTSIDQGAKLEIGGKIPDREGFYYPPTVLTNVKKGIPAYEQEIFGPVISFINVKNEEEAIQVANDTKYGLSAAVFTQDIARGKKIATEKIEAGTCAVNTFVTSDPRLPFGGIKQSGYGRELSAEGIHEFVNIKTINIK